jgi:hypothetical protein
MVALGGAGWKKSGMAGQWRGGAWDPARERCGMLSRAHTAEDRGAGRAALAGRGGFARATPA